MKKNTEPGREYRAVATDWNNRRHFLTHEGTWSRRKAEARTFRIKGRAWVALEDAIDDNRFLDSGVEEI